MSVDGKTEDDEIPTFARHLRMVEVIYDPQMSDVPNMTLQELAYDIIEGNSTGRDIDILTEPLTRSQSAALSELQGSSPQFLDPQYEG